METEELWPISEVARLFGLRVSALRYYDEIGLLRPAARRGTVRHYGRAELRRLALLRRLHHDGMVSLAETGELLADHPPGDRPPTRELLTRSIAAIEVKVAELRAAQEVLEHLLSCPTGDPVRQCRYLRAELDRMTPVQPRA